MTSADNQAKVLAHLLDKNLNILEHDYQLMLFRIQKSMNKLTNNNTVFSEIYKEGVNDWCDSIDNTIGDFKKLISEYDKLEDSLQSVDILSKKISLFKMMTESLVNKYCEEKAPEVNQ